MTTGIYMIWVRNPRGDVHSYVGRAVNIERRWAAHRADYRNGRHNKAFSNVANKYGIENLEWEILEEFPEGTAEAELERAEQSWLDLGLGSMNVSRSAGGGAGLFACPEVRARWEVNQKAGAQKRSADPEWRVNNKAAMQKRSADPEWRVNNKAALQKLHADPEYQSKMADPEHLANRKAATIAATQHPLRREWASHNSHAIHATRRGDLEAAAYHRAEAARLNAAYRAEKVAHHNI